MASSDPANVYSLSLEGVARDPFTRPRGTGAFVVTLRGTVILSIEGRGRRILTRPESSDAEIGASLHAFVAHIAPKRAIGRRHDVVVETIDGEPAVSATHASALQAAGFRVDGRSLRYYAAVR